MTSNAESASEAAYIGRNADLFCCPACQGDLAPSADGLACAACGRAYPATGDLPRMFVANAWESSSVDVTDQIKQFYEATPFPNYDDFDSAASLVEKARRGVFARLLDEQIPSGARVLEAGCGTGQLTNFLSISNRTVFGVDICLNSLGLAKAFRDTNRLKTAHFLQMNLFRPCFKPRVFDLVVSNGVLHHTSDPRLAFRTLANLVKPGGYLVVGLYHRYGRLATDLRRLFFNLSRDRWKSLDPLNVNLASSDGRRRAWFMDQYKNPHESKHTIAQVLRWLNQAGLSFVKSIPGTTFGASFSHDERLFRPEPPGGTLERSLVEFSMSVWTSQIKEGGFFVVIARANR